MTCLGWFMKMFWPDKIRSCLGLLSLSSPGIDHIAANKASNQLRGQTHKLPDDTIHIYLIVQHEGTMVITFFHDLIKIH